MYECMDEIIETSPGNNRPDSLLSEIQRLQARGSSSLFTMCHTITLAPVLRTVTLLVCGF